MTIIIGLGNPGKKFEKTRHNVGFLAVDKFAEENSFPEFELQKKYASIVAEKNGLILAKPQTFMNESGKAVKKILAKENAENLIVIHDDIDLPIGKIKIVKDRGSAGHKGIESIIQNIGNDNLIRIRIGIANPSFAEASDGQEKKIKAKAVVLKKFSEEEQKMINEAIQKTVKAIGILTKEGLDKAMNEFN
jgi:peptidyl-tRNA hydrolase, PTH1 family